MPDQKTSQLPQTTAVNLDDTVGVVQEGQNRQSPWEQIVDLVLGVFKGDRLTAADKQNASNDTPKAMSPKDVVDILGFNGAVEPDTVSEDISGAYEFTSPSPYMFLNATADTVITFKVPPPSNKDLTVTVDIAPNGFAVTIDPRTVRLVREFSINSDANTITRLELKLNREFVGETSRYYELSGETDVYGFGVLDYVATFKRTDLFAGLSGEDTDYYHFPMWSAETVGSSLKTRSQTSDIVSPGEFDRGLTLLGTAPQASAPWTPLFGSNKHGRFDGTYFHPSSAEWYLFIAVEFLNPPDVAETIYSERKFGNPSGDALTLRRTATGSVEAVLKRGAGTITATLAAANVPSGVLRLELTRLDNVVKLTCLNNGAVSNTPSFSSLSGSFDLDRTGVGVIALDLTQPLTGYVHAFAAFQKSASGPTGRAGRLTRYRLWLEDVLRVKGLAVETFSPTDLATRAYVLANVVSNPGSPAAPSKVFYIGNQWVYPDGSVYGTRPANSALEFVSTGTPYALPSLAADKFNPTYDAIDVPDNGTAPLVLLIVGDSTTESTLTATEKGYRDLIQGNPDGLGGGWVDVVTHSAQSALPGDVTTRYRAVVISPGMTSTNVKAAAASCRALNMPVMWLGRTGIETYSRLGVASADPFGQAVATTGVNPTDFVYSVFRGQDELHKTILNNTASINGIPTTTLIPGFVILARAVGDASKAAVLFAPGGLTIAPGQPEQAVLGANAFRAHWPTNSALDLTAYGRMAFLRLLNLAMGFESANLIEAAPSIPVGLQGVGGNLQASLAWTRNPEPDMGHYLVQRATAEAGPYSTVSQVPQSAAGVNPSYVDTLETNGTYYYRIAAVDTSGQASSYTTAIEVLTAAQTLAAPATLTLKILSPTSIEAVWAAVPNAEGYQMKVNNGAYTSVGNVVEEELIGLTSGVATTVSVRAVLNGATGPAVTATETSRFFKAAVITKDMTTPDPYYDDLYAILPANGWQHTYIKAAASGDNAGSLDYSQYDALIADVGLFQSLSNIPPKTLDKPFLVMEPLITDNLALGAEATTANTQDTIKIKLPNHPMLADLGFTLDQLVSVYTATGQNLSRILISSLPSGAEVIAEHPTDPTLAMLVAYPVGITLVDGVTATTKRRVFGPFNTSPGRFTSATGEALFLAMLNWVHRYQGVTVNA